MGSTSIHVSYRPLRIGFLVPEGATDLIAEAAKINSLLWGGIYNPIIPVGADPDQVRRLISTFTVDTVFCLDDSIDLSRFCSEHDQRRYQTFNRRLGLRAEAWQSQGTGSYCLDILSAMNHVWGKFTHAWPAEREGKHVKLSWSEDDPERMLFTVLFGAFPQKESAFEHAFAKTLRSSEVFFSPQNLIPQVVVEKRPLISVSAYLLQDDRRTRLSGSLYLGRAECFEDLVFFWNLRAAGVPLFFCNCSKIDRWASAIQAYLRQHDIGAPNKRQVRGGIAAYCNGLAEEYVDAFRRSVDCPPKLHICDLRKGIETEPAIPRFQTETVLASVDNRAGSFHVSLALPPPCFLDTGDRRADVQHFVAIFSPTTEFEFPFHTIRVPFLGELTSEFGGKMLIDPFASTVQDDGIGRVVSRIHQTIHIRPLHYSSIVGAILRHRGIGASPSQPGLLVMSLLQQLGGMNNMWPLKIRGVRKLIKEFRVDQSFSRCDAVRCISDGGTYKNYKFFVDPRRTEPGQLLKFLVEHGLLMPGLDFTCGNYGLSNWLPLNRIDQTWDCEYCGQRQQTAPFLTQASGKWKFRKSGLLGKDNNQEGAIPVLLSLSVFESLLDAPGLAWAPAMKLDRSDEIDCEVDFCILQYANHSEGSWSVQSRAEIGIAECKDEGNKIDDRDIANMVSVYSRLNSLDLRCYLIFSRTTDSFTSAEIDRFRTLKEKKIPVILLTNSELESDQAYEDIPSDACLPVANTLQTISWRSDRKYLEGRAS